VLVGWDIAAIGGTIAVTGFESPWAIGYWALVMILLSFSGAYGVRIALQALNEVPALTRRLSIPVLAVLAARAWLAIDASVVVQAVLTLPVLTASRLCAYGVLRRARRRHHLLQPTLIVGSGDIASEIARLLQRHPEYGLVPVGFVDTVPPNGDRQLAVPLLGSLHHLEYVLDQYSVQHIIVADGPPKGSESEWVGILRSAILHDVEMHVTPRFPDLGLVAQGTGADEIWGIPLHRVRRSAMRTTAWRVKRAFDVVFGALLLLPVAPLMGAIALVVRLGGPGPIIYRQRRIGQHGRPFELLKFRSMRTSHDGATSWTAAMEDQTRVGRWLRRTSLDELPQLWNVLRGDMSLVGPRPERPHFVQRFGAEIPGYLDRHRVAVGITGWAQIHGLKGDNTSLQDRARFDNLYIERWSLWLDLVTIARTVGTIGRDLVDCLLGPAQERRRSSGGLPPAARTSNRSLSDRRELVRPRSH
jgi:exopolysaccharide biosynthesis polyprenyl glycosylphosphotransferase